MNKLVLTKTHFILKLSSTINAIPEVVKDPGYDVTGDRTKQQSKNQEPTLLEENGSKGEIDAPVLLASEQDLTLPRLKGILLNEAEGRVKFILQDLEVKYKHQLSECTAVDLERTIEAKLQLSEIAQQRQHIAESIAMSFSALKNLQEAKLFTAKIKRVNKDGQIREEIAEESSSIHPRESEARERLSINTWLRCRLAFVASLTRQIRGIALHDQDLLDGSALITEGIVEADTFNDSESQAQFMLQAAFLDIQEGHSRKGIQLMLKNIIHLLQGKCFMSPVAYLTLAQSLILSADLMGNNENHQLVWTNQLNNYKLAHQLITKQLICLGETIEHSVTQSMVSSSGPALNNIYLPQICLLAKVQMRIGHILTLQANSPSESVNPSYILPSLNLCNMALGLCRLSAFRQRDLEAELLFLKGKIERLMFALGDHEKSCAIKSLSDAINISRDNDQNFSLIRKCYLEIALVYLHMSSLEANRTDTIFIQDPKTPTAPKRKVDKVMEQGGGRRTVSPSELYRLLAWIAVRAATQVATAMLAYKQLIGEKDVVVQATKTKLHQNIPAFACRDLLATYKKYLQDDLHNCADIQELADESPIDGKKRGGDSLPIDMLSWIHVIRYHNHLMRLKDLLTMTDFDNGKVPATDTLYTSVFDNGITVRYAEMHLFLKKCLYSYSTCCVNDFPAELLWGLEQKTTGFYTPSKANLGGKELIQCTSQPLKSPSTVLLESKLEVHREQMSPHALDQELCLQWYSPLLERSRQDQGKPMVLLMYAYNKQNIDVKDPRKCDPSVVLCGYLWVSLTHVQSLHENFCNLVQKAEISIHNVSNTSVPGSGEKQKRSAQMVTNNPDLKPVKITEEEQAMFLQCCSQAQALLSTDPDLQPITQAPFDITLPSLIRLGRVFDLTHGCMLMKGSLLDWTVSQLT